MVSYLTEELVAMGHEVTLFASGDSTTQAELIAVSPCALRLNRECVDPYIYHTLLLEQVFQRHEAFDLIHFHTITCTFRRARRLELRQHDYSSWPAGYTGPGAVLPRVRGNARDVDF